MTALLFLLFLLISVCLLGMIYGCVYVGSENDGINKRLKKGDPRCIKCHGHGYYIDRETGIPFVCLCEVKHDEVA